MTSAMAIDLAERRVNEFRQRCGDYGEAALRLAYHAALPVALNAELLHLLRINFFLDPPETLPYTVEFEFLLSPLCREIDQGLYEIEPEVRDALLAGLTQTYETQRIRDLATLLWQYVEHHSPWGDRVELERAQQLTALNFLDAEKAKQWLSTVDPNASQGEVAEREWFVAMRQEIEKQTQFQQDEAAIDRLLVALQASNHAVRQRAVEALGNLGSEAAIPVLISALHDENNTVRSSAAEALGKIGSEAAIPALIGALSDINNVVRSSTAEALGKIGSELAIPALASALGDPNKNVRLSVTEALGKIGSGSAIPALLEALNDSDSEVRQHTASTLMKLGHDQENDDLFDSVLDRLTEETYIASLRSISDSKEWIIRGEVMRIGRGEGNDLILQQPEVSRQHAEIVRRDFQDGVTQPTYSLHDFSRCGTWISTPENREWQLIQQQEVELAPGTQLRFGNPRGPILEFSITPIEVLGQESNGNTTATGMVLWVDDHPNNNIYERQSLEESGIQFVLATTTEEALELLNQQRFDVIISDMGRPPDQRAGYTLLDQLRLRNNQTPFIIYAGSKDPKYVAEARRRGAIGCTNDPSELSQMVLSAIGQTKSNRASQQGDTSHRESSKPNDVGLEEANRLNDLAKLYTAQGRYVEAVSLYEQVLELRRQILGEQHLDTVLSLGNLADIYAQQGQVNQAIDLYQQSLAAEESIGDVKGKAATLHQMADIYAQQGQVNQAIDLYQQSLALYESIGNVQGKAAILHQLAIIHRDTPESGEISSLDGLPNNTRIQSLHESWINRFKNSTDVDPLHRFILDDPEKQLTDHIRGRPEATFRFLLLARLEGQSWDEIATILGPPTISKPTLSSFFNRQLRKREGYFQHYRQVLEEEHSSVPQTLDNLETLHKQMAVRSQPEAIYLFPEQRRRLEKDEAKLQEQEAALNRHLQNLRRDYVVEKNAAKRLKLQKQIEAIDLEIEHLQAELEKISQQLS